jgi:hypothetical protein
MKLVVDPPDEWRAAGKGTVRGLLKLIPGVGVPLAAYEEFDKRRKQKAFDEFHADLQRKLERVEARANTEWLQSEDGQMFASKVVDAALDAQMTDKRELFSNVLVNGLLSEDLPSRTKMKFVDLLRSLSRAALDVLAEIHRYCGPALKASGASHISDTETSKHIATGTGMDPYLVGAAVAELRAEGLFSNVPSWEKDLQGRPRPSGQWLNEGQGYTEFTERFVMFIKEPE